MALALTIVLGLFLVLLTVADLMPLAPMQGHPVIRSRGRPSRPA